MRLDYVDIFYSHRFDPDTPLEETMGALDTAVRQGKALYVGISSYSAQKTREAAEILRGLGTPLLIHQPSYSMLNRWIETEGLLDTLGELGIGCIGFSPLAQGMLSGPLPGRQGPEGLACEPEGLALARPPHRGDARQDPRAERDRRGAAARRSPRWRSPGRCATRASPRPWSAPRSVAQLEENLAALDSLHFTEDELAEIDRHASDSGINLWVESSRN